MSKNSNFAFCSVSSCTIVDTGSTELNSERVVPFGILILWTHKQACGFPE